MAKKAFEQQGAVGGAAWKEDLSVEHILIDQESDMPKLRKSKYLQSYLGNIDAQVKKRLQQGQFVLFSGCPCQIAGLRAYLGKDYENLITIDLLCGNSPSAGFFQKYLQDAFGDQVASYEFRNKAQGWNSDCVSIQLKSGEHTAVAGVAAGNGRNSGGRYAGVAMQSELIVVKLGNPIQEGFPRTTELMMGIDYIIRKALELRMPVAVNISFGNTYGGHDGTTLLERYIDDVSNIWKSVFCIGTGNEAASAGHTSGRIISEGEETIQLAIQSRQSSISIQIWKEYTDQIEISIINPSGVRVGPVPEILGPHRFRIGQTEILLYYGEPSPYSISQEIYIDLLPVESYLTEGIWRIVLSAGKIVTGQYEMWLPSDNVLNRGTGFLFPTDATTLTIPSSASRAISVGAYDARTFAYADFSGRGFTRLTNMVKPDLVAPGVEVMTTTVGGEYAAFTGTSFATPFVTGSAALLMEWGIVRGNDPYLYGEKVKAYLRRGAKKVPGFDEYPNEEVGYGALCTAQSIPKI